jgi:hypothetical protein
MRAKQSQAERWRFLDRHTLVSKLLWAGTGEACRIVSSRSGVDERIMPVNHHRVDMLLQPTQDPGGHGSSPGDCVWCKIYGESCRTCDQSTPRSPIQVVSCCTAVRTIYADKP